MTQWSRASTTRVGVVVIGLATLITFASVGFFSGTVPTTTSPTLIVTDANGTELVTAPIDPETEITIEYTHSVERTLVRDVYVVTDAGTLAMVRMEFSSFGAGLPAQAEVTQENGRYVYEPTNREYETLRIRTGHIADHDLIVGDERYDIAAMTDGGSVKLTIENRR